MTSLVWMWYRNTEKRPERLWTIKYIEDPLEFLRAAMNVTSILEQEVLGSPDTFNIKVEITPKEHVEHYQIKRRWSSYRGGFASYVFLCQTVQTVKAVII